MSKTPQTEEPDLPLGYFANETTEFLVKTRNRKSGAECYELTWELVRRASHNGEFKFLLKLITSKNDSRKGFGSFLIGEISDKTGLVWPAIRKHITLWSDDWMPSYRYSFVNFIIGTKYYDEKISGGMQKCLEDEAAFVRASAIFWLCIIKPAIFQNFHQFCSESRQQGDKHSRLNRAFEIAGLMRSGKTAEFLFEAIKFEDYETLKDLERRESLIARHMRKW